jgi:hypothetical protein
VTHLSKRMLGELHRRNYSESTIRGYLQAVQQFAVHFRKSPDKLGPEELRSYQPYLLGKILPAIPAQPAFLPAPFSAVNNLDPSMLPKPVHASQPRPDL